MIRTRRRMRREEEADCLVTCDAKDLSKKVADLQNNRGSRVAVGLGHSSQLPSNTISHCLAVRALRMHE